MSRKRPSTLYLAGRSKNQKVVSELVQISGRIKKLVYPPAAELFDGFVVIQLVGEKRVAGRLPFLDFNFVYNFCCSKESSRYGVSYKIESFQDPPFEPMKLTCLSLAVMLQNTLGYSRSKSETKVHEFRAVLEEYSADTGDLDPEWLLRVPRPQPRWLVRLSHASLLFKYRNLINLQRFWTCDQLSKIPVYELARVVDVLPQNIFDFCFHWKNDFHLPELNARVVTQVCQAYNRPMPGDLYGVVATYNNAKNWRNRHGQMSIPREAFAEWPYNPQLCLKHNVILPTFVSHNGQHMTRYFIASDLKLIKDCAKRINELFAIDALAVVPRKNLPANIDILNDQQRAAYDAVFRNNFIVVLGDAGTGKTLLGEFIYKSYHVGKVLPTAFFGKVASNLKEKYGRGITIHKLVKEIEKPTKLGQKYAKQTEILIIDEGSTLTLELIVMALKSLPKLKKVIILGDEKQMPPPSWGAIFDALVEHFKDTPSLHRLTEVMRVDEKLRILKDNFNRIIRGDAALSYSTDITSDHPFVVLSRVSVDPETELRETPAQRIDRMRRSLRPVFQHYEDANVYHIVTQKNVVRNDLNHAVFLETHPENKYTHNVFSVGEKIMFKENDYGSGDSKKEREKHCSSSAVMNGEIVTISRILDIDPNDRTAAALAKALEVSNTHAPKQVAHWNRMIYFDDGRKINLNHYSIGNIVKGTVSTVASIIGSEYDVIVVYLHDNFTDFLRRKEFYTAVTRARSRVVLVTQIDEETGELPEVKRVIENDPEPPECLIGYWLHKWTQAPVASGVPAVN